MPLNREEGVAGVAGAGTFRFTTDFSDTTISSIAVGAPTCFSPVSLVCRYLASAKSLKTAKSGEVDEEMVQSDEFHRSHESAEKKSNLSLASWDGRSILVYSSERRWLMAANTCVITSYDGG